ncbi:DUF72 domain-containing protein [Singulisphaera sp. PoT]|uniref:DUF72 domain-containing protein n=1 Tax=Singulisphaera sp. PoT TaxID=3411797 RepID=UPI003BF5F354
MRDLPLFSNLGDDEVDDLPAQAARLAPRLRALSDEGIYFGTSSWKYEGWLGSVYSPNRYETRGKFSKKKFDTECLEEYAQVFPAVCGDFAFYQFPSAELWKQLFSDTPDSFLFAFKVPEDITVARWPGHARYGTKAGTENPHFLNAAILKKLFLQPLKPYTKRIASLILEFGTFAKSTFPTPDHFLDRLDDFLADLPGGFRFSIEIRNPEYLGANYFTLLSSHNVAHVFNAWTRMPELEKQVGMTGVVTADHLIARALLSKGRLYEDAVKRFEPYQALKEPNRPARDALCSIANLARQRKKPAFLFINNRLEGHAPSTIEGTIDLLSGEPL